DVGILAEGIDHLGQRLDALFTRHLACGQLHGLDGGELFRPGKPGQDDPHGNGIVQVRVLMQRLLGQGGFGFTADGIGGQPLLETVIGVVGDITDPAAVYDGRLLLLGQEAVEFGVVAGGDDQGVDRPLVAVDLDGPVLNDSQIDLDQILLILEDLVGEMYAASGDPGQGAAPQIETVGIVGVGDMQQTLDRLLAQQIYRGRGDLVLGRILARHGAQALAHRHRNHLHKVEHPLQVPVAEFADIVPDIAAAGAHGAVVLIEDVDGGIVQPPLFGQETAVIPD